MSAIGRKPTSAGDNPEGRPPADMSAGGGTAQSGGADHMLAAARFLSAMKRSYQKTSTGLAMNMDE